MAIETKPDEFFDELETMSVKTREKYLNQRLSQTVDHAYHHAPAVKKIFDEAGVSPDQIRIVKDLERLPIIRKTDLIEWQKANPPYGGFLAISPEDVDRIFISPGPVYEPIQHAGIKWFAKAFWAAGFRKGDVVINTFAYHMSPGGILFHEALRDCGATAIPMGIGNTDIQIQTMYDLKVTGFVGTPSFLMTIIRRAESWVTTSARVLLYIVPGLPVRCYLVPGLPVRCYLLRYGKPLRRIIKLPPHKPMRLLSRAVPSPMNATRNRACTLWMNI